MDHVAVVTCQAHGGDGQRLGSCVRVGLKLCDACLMGLPECKMQNHAFNSNLTSWASACQNGCGVVRSWQAPRPLSLLLSLLSRLIRKGSHSFANSGEVLELHGKVLPRLWALPGNGVTWQSSSQPSYMSGG